MPISDQKRVSKVFAEKARRIAKWRQSAGGKNFQFCDSKRMQVGIFHISVGGFGNFSTKLVTWPGSGADFTLKSTLPEPLFAQVITMIIRALSLLRH